jgi:hypothetical protein
LLRIRELAHSLVTGFALVLTATPAHAYIDPGTGGMLLQLLLGGLAGAAVIVRLQWERIRETTRRLFSGRDQPGEDNSGS